MAQPLKFEKGKIISSGTLLDMWLHIHAGIEVNLWYEKGPCIVE